MSSIPSTCSDEWLHYEGELPPLLMLKGDRDVSLRGKWIVWCKKSQLDSVWHRARRALAEGRIEGVDGMKCSTLVGGPRASLQGEHAMIFYNQSGQEASILRAGRSIIRHMYCKDTIFFKTNQQTRAGTVTTGQLRNWRFYLRVGASTLGEPREVRSRSPRSSRAQTTSRSWEELFARPPTSNAGSSGEPREKPSPSSNLRCCAAQELSATG